MRGVVEDRVDPAPLWRQYVDQGWTELTEPSEAVELGILVEELGRATDPTPFLATLTQFAPLAPGRARPGVVRGGVFEGVTAARTDDGWRARRHGAARSRR